MRKRQSENELGRARSEAEDERKVNVHYLLSGLIDEALSVNMERESRQRLGQVTTIGRLGRSMIGLLWTLPEVTARVSHVMRVTCVREVNMS